MCVVAAAHPQVKHRLLHHCSSFIQARVITVYLETPQINQILKKGPEHVAGIKPTTSAAAAAAALCLVFAV